MNDLIKMLPIYYRRSDFVNTIFKKITDFLNNHALNDKDFFITTTSKYDKFLENVGINPNIAVDDETKRAMVIARLQGQQLFTINALKALIALFYNGSFTLSETKNKVIITFSEDEGLPGNIKQMIAQINTQKPAHVEILIKITYMTWEQAAAQIGTWNKAKTYTWGHTTQAKED